VLLIKPYYFFAAYIRYSSQWAINIQDGIDNCTGIGTRIFWGITKTLKSSLSALTSGFLS